MSIGCAFVGTYGLSSSFYCWITTCLFAPHTFIIDWLFSWTLGMKSAIIPLPESLSFLPFILIFIFDFLIMYLWVCLIFWIIGKIKNRNQDIQ